MITIVSEIRIVIVVLVYYIIGRHSSRQRLQSRQEITIVIVVLLYSIYQRDMQIIPEITSASEDRECIRDQDCISGSIIQYILERYADPTRNYIRVKRSRMYRRLGLYQWFYYIVYNREIQIPPEIPFATKDRECFGDQDCISSSIIQYIIEKYRFHQKFHSRQKIANVSEIRIVLVVLLYSIYYIIDICRSHPRFHS